MVEPKLEVKKTENGWQVVDKDGGTYGTCSTEEKANILAKEWADYFASPMVF